VVSYNVIITKQALNEIASLDRRADRARIMDRIHKLASNPRPHGSKNLKARPSVTVSGRVTIESFTRFVMRFSLSRSFRSAIAKTSTAAAARRIRAQ
jgi:hypothetical protein